MCHSAAVPHRTKSLITQRISSTYFATVHSDTTSYKLSRVSHVKQIKHDLRRRKLKLTVSGEVWLLYLVDGLVVSNDLANKQDNQQSACK